MAHFVCCDSGWVNLDHVAKVLEHTRPNGDYWLTFENASGAVIGRKSRATERLNELTAPIIPAAAGMVAVVICPYSECDEGRPDKVHVDHVPIVAWRLIYDGACPVLIEAPLSGATVFVTMPDGALMSPEDVTFSNLDFAIAGVLEFAQGDWDRANARRLKALCVTRDNGEPLQ
jgi:hypothetical protein